jgi:hypothetical protein
VEIQPKFAALGLLNFGAISTMAWIGWLDRKGWSPSPMPLSTRNILSPSQPNTFGQAHQKWSISL